MDTSPLRAPLRPTSDVRQLFLGLGLGAIPLAIWLAFIGWSVSARAGCRSGPAICGYPGLAQLIWGLVIFAVLWLVQLVITIDMLAHRRQRFLGYGLLVPLLIGPIVGTIACIYSLHPVR